jgi:hypothetical protein
MEDVAGSDLAWGQWPSAKASVASGKAWVPRSTWWSNRNVQPYAEEEGSNIVEQDEGSLSVVHLRGLPYRATVQDVMGFLDTHANNLHDGSKSVQLIMNHKGRPSGFAKLWFNTPEAAVACCSELHLRNLEDRYIEVFLHVDSPDRKQGAKQQSTRQRTRAGKQVPHEQQGFEEGSAHFSESTNDTESHYNSQHIRNDNTSDSQLLICPENDTENNNMLSSVHEKHVSSLSPDQCIPTSDMITSPLGYCGDGMIMDDGALHYGFDCNNPGYYTHVQFVPVVYCYNFVGAPSLQNGDGVAMAEALPICTEVQDGTQSDSTTDATPTQKDIIMINNQENFSPNQENLSPNQESWQEIVSPNQQSAGNSKIRNYRNNKWVDLLKLVPKQSSDSSGKSELS